MKHELFNLFRGIPSSLGEEEVSPLLAADGVRIERIVSTGQSTPPDFWYDQEEHEWVLVLRGRGVIEYADGTTVALQAGDSLYLPARVRHRVRETSHQEPTVWLAIFWRAAPSSC